MGCKVIVYYKGVQSKCNEPELIPGYCYDHCHPCKMCGQPTNPRNNYCSEHSTQCKYCGIETINTGTKMCDNCWEVETRRLDYYY